MAPSAASAWKGRLQRKQGPGPFSGYRYHTIFNSLVFAYVVIDRRYHTSYETAIQEGTREIAQGADVKFEVVRTAYASMPREWKNTIQKDLRALDESLLANLINGDATLERKE